MLRRLLPAGTCSRCGAAGPVWVSSSKPLDMGAGVILEAGVQEPPLCDGCEALVACPDCGVRWADVAAGRDEHLPACPQAGQMWP